METRTPEVRNLTIRVLEISEAAAGRFARVRVSGLEGPGRMRFFDIPAEDFQVGDRLEFSLVRVNRKMAIGQAQPIVLGPDDFKNGIYVDADPNHSSVVDICPGCSVCAPAFIESPDEQQMEPTPVPGISGQGAGAAEITAAFEFLEESVPTGHDTVHPKPEGA